MKEVREKIGILLRKERKRQGISLEDISEQLKIIHAHLRCIENGETEDLPSELYFSLFAKSYAEFLGIDYSRTVEAINEEIDQEKFQKETQVKEIVNITKEKMKEGFDEQKIKIMFIGGGVLAAFLIFVFMNWLFSGESPVEVEDNYTIEDSLLAEPEIQAAVINYDWDNIEYPADVKLAIRLTPREGSWATVVADGDTVIYRTLNAGRVYVAQADYRLLVSIGIPSVVDVELNGQQVNLRNPVTKRISRVEINSMNLKSFTEAEEINTGAQL
jgi:transcriptional regulator with XRE-family HTH domain